MMGEVASVVVAVFVVLVVTIGWKLLCWLWLTPKKYERQFRAQGLKGAPYRFWYGESKSLGQAFEEARSKPMELSHRVQPRAMAFMYQNMEKYGKVFFTWFGTTPWFVTTDPDMVKEVYTDKLGRISKIPTLPYDLLLAGGLADYQGEKWVKHRKIINPAFHTEKLKRMVPSFEACTNDMVSKWHNLFPQKKTFELNIWPLLQDFTADIISRVGFGTTYEQGQRIFELHTEQTLHLIEAYQSIYVPGFERLPTKRNKRMYAIYNEVGTLLTNILKKREDAMRRGEAPHDDLLSLLMESNRKEIEANDNSKEYGMTRFEVIEECRLFYFAAQETTATLLVWTLIVLAMHRDWQDKAREEVFQVFGNRSPDFEGVYQLKTVNMILHEILRLYTPPTYLMRATTKTMQLGKYTLPPGVNIVMPGLLVHHDPEFWGKDADEFKPERFAEGVSKATHNPNAFFPFGMGPRICIGQNFVMLEAKVALAVLLRQFSFELSPSYKHAPFYGAVTIQPQHGAPLTIHKI